MPNSLDLWRDDPGWPLAVDIIEDTFINYRWHRMLPAAGGWFEQDTHWCDAMKLMDDVVEWWKQNDDKRGDLPALEDVMAERRRQFRGDD